MNAILITTFLRDDLLYRTVPTVFSNLPPDTIVIIGDQGKASQSKNEWVTKMEHYHNDKFYYYELPFDCGLSTARNFLVQKAKEKRCDKCIISADSISFKDMKRLDTIIASLNAFDFDLVGFNLENRIPWEANIRLLPGEAFELDFLRTKKGKYNDWAVAETYPVAEPKLNPIARTGIYHCELVKNFFIANTSSLIACKWDENLKLFEHEDFFYRYTQAGFQVGWTPDVKGEYNDFKPPEYLRYRERMYGEFKRKLQAKYGIRGWIKYKGYFS